MEKIIVKAIIAADKKSVWEYYTLPEHITQWNFADPSWHCPAAQNDLRVGGTYVARMEARDGSFGFDFEAKYTRLLKYELMSYEFGGRFADISFINHENGTEVTITFDPETENPIELQREGWQSILNNFKNYVQTIRT